MSAYAADMALSPEHFNFQYVSGFFDAWRNDAVNFGGRYDEATLGAQLACAQVCFWQNFFCCIDL